MDFIQIAVKEQKGGGFVAYPDFIVQRSDDLMVRAKSFYAVWDEDAEGPGMGLWSTNEYDVVRLVDGQLHKYQKENPDVISIKRMQSFGSNGQSTFRKYMSQIGDNYRPLDEKLTFQGTKVGKKDYVSKRLPYDLAPGDISAWDELVGTLYVPEQRAKIEWAIGSIISGDSKKLQKFVVLYGPPGAGKGTIINICLKLFDGYITTFDAKALGSHGNQFAAAAFSNNPLVAIQHDGDLSRIEDNTLLNSIVSHEIMRINEKHKPAYDSKINAFLIMGTNKPVKITDAQSGLIRRLIDVHPSGNKLAPRRYHQLMEQIDFSLGAVAEHCLRVYKQMGKNYYSNYQPMEMMFKTNAFFNYIETNYDLFKKQDGTSVKQAWNLYKEFCEEANIKDAAMKLYVFKSELGNYFEKYHERHTIVDEDGKDTIVRSWYSGFKPEPFKTPVDDPKTQTFTLVLEETISLLNNELAEYPAQYAKADGTPSKYWDDGERVIGGKLKRPDLSQVVNTLLRDLDTTKEHYVKTPANLLTVDFDIRDEKGEKSLELNLAAAAEWPATYAELSKSGKGVHLEYYYTGDPAQVDPNYAPGIELKFYTGNSALRRRVTKCNNVPIASLSSGLPLKENKRVLSPGTMTSEKGLRSLIERNLRKEVHPGTKPSIDFIKKVLDDAYNDGLVFDVTDMRSKVIQFANGSTNRAMECLSIVQEMRWKSDDDIPETPAPVDEAADKRLVFFDCEVAKNVFIVCWKFQEEPGVKPSPDNVVRMINPSPQEIETLMRMRLVGFNNKGYDNHILFARSMGYSNEKLYELSKKLIGNVVDAKFNNAGKVSYVDVFDYATNKQSLKKWQIALGIDHREMDVDWDKPIPENRIMELTEYCVNDVVSLEETHNHLQGDFTARQILADLSGLPVNDSTAAHTARIVFGNERNPQRHFVYTDLSKEFPGYTFGPRDGVKGNPLVSTYRGEIVGEGGLVRAKEGLYENVVLLDVASMHPTSIGQLNLFGDFTPRFMDLVRAQLVLKHFYPDDLTDDETPDFEPARKLLDGKLTKYIDEIELLDRTDRPAARKATKELRYGLKIAVNIVYGLSSAKFDNKFRDMRNVDNIVAKRGALFMVNLMHFIEDELGLSVIHIKTDSVKIPGATAEDIRRIQEFGRYYGYDLEHEATYAKFGLVNDAVYVAKKEDCATNCWSATGTQFQHPYVFKKLFGMEDQILFKDLCETKAVQKGKLFLDFGAHEMTTLPEKIENPDDLGWIDNALVQIKAAERRLKIAEKSGDQQQIQDANENLIQASAAYDEALSKLIFIGKVGRFTPVVDGYGGGTLYRVMDFKPYAVAGTKGRLWVDAKIAETLPGDAIDYSYFEELLTSAKENLAKYLEDSPFKSLEEFVA